MDPFLWQNTDRTVTLIDVPRSIAAAQGTQESPCCDFLLSTKPLESPYPGNEPKSEAAKAKLAGNNTVDIALHEELQRLAADALEQIKLSQGKWCFPRPFVQDRPRTAKKRKREEEPESSASVIPTVIDLPHDLLLFHAMSGLTRAYGVDGDDSANEYDEADPEVERSPAQLTLSDPRPPKQSYKFRIPPKSSFSLTDCQKPRELHSAIRAQAQELDTRRTFDFILLDPPWPNSSVKRTHKTPNSTYTTSATLDDIRQLILGMDLDILMANDCLVGIWITNRPSIRDCVLGEDGIFACWGVELVEEWIWLKTTTHGEPVGKLDSVWRKPYEVLLLGRKRRTYCASEGAEIQVKRRVLCSVPDLHSRKPCLKTLVEPLLPAAVDYRALEVFARHLVAGWWSWGNECIKFNWNGYWQRPDQER